MSARDKRRLLQILTLSASALAGCGGEQHRELQAELAQLAKDVRGRVEPLPQVKPYEAVPFTAEAQIDPFRPERIHPGKSDERKETRPREPLEAFALESIEMLGTITKGEETFALVRAGSSLYRVQKGSRMGQNSGVITAIDGARISLRELAQDAEGNWTERSSALLLAETRR